jgi:AcrR family transcriptional regulator
MTQPSSAPASEDTRDRILTEAERLFRHYGYAKTTVADIAGACSMSPSNVYRFFASKSEINEAICARIIADLESRLRRIARGDAPAAERLRAFIVEMHGYTVRTLLDQKKVHEMVVVAMEEQWGAISAHIDCTRRLLQDIIVSGVESGEFTCTDARMAACCASAAIASLKHPVVVSQCMDDPNRPSPEEMADFLLLALRA